MSHPSDSRAGTDVGDDRSREAEPPSSYHAPVLEARVVASDTGRGLFALQPIDEGTLLVAWGGVVVDENTLSHLPGSRKRLSIQIEDELYLVVSREGPADYVNHSCEPNAGLSGQINLVAMRSIRRGEEITYDYAMGDGSSYDEFDCGCGARSCRKRITGRDWEIAELQRRYRGYFSPYLERRIRAKRLGLPSSPEIRLT